MIGEFIKKIYDKCTASNVLYTWMLIHIAGIKFLLWDNLITGLVKGSEGPITAALFNAVVGDEKGGKTGKDSAVGNGSSGFFGWLFTPQAPKDNNTSSNTSPPDHPDSASKLEPTTVHDGDTAPTSKLKV